MTTKSTDEPGERATTRPVTRTTHTFVILELSPAAYEEIKTKLEAAGYQDAFIEQDGRTVIDLHGISVTDGDQTTANGIGRTG